MGLWREWPRDINPQSSLIRLSAKVADKTYLAKRRSGKVIRMGVKPPIAYQIPGGLHHLGIKRFQHQLPPRECDYVQQPGFGLFKPFQDETTLRDRLDCVERIFGERNG